MKLNLVPASQGVMWLRMGVRTFFRQPLAMSGLFFLFLVGASVLSVIPWVGNLISLVLLPGLTVGFMAAAQGAQAGKFPMPWVLITAFRRGPAGLRAMLTLGTLYALCILVVLGVTTLVDGGQFAKMYLVGGKLTEEVVTQPAFLRAGLVASILYLPVSLLFWHAPALVMWYGVSPVKSVFFSLMACKRNFAALLIYGLGWVAVALCSSMVAAVLASLVAEPSVAAVIMMPLALLLAAMFFTSLYFTFADCFETPPGDPP